jgi:hypothetical protein
MGSNRDDGLGLATDPLTKHKGDKAFPGHTVQCNRRLQDRSAVAMRAREGGAETRRSVGVVGRSASERTKYAGSRGRRWRGRSRRQSREQGPGQHSRPEGGRTEGRELGWQRGGRAAGTGGPNNELARWAAALPCGCDGVHQRCRYPDARAVGRVSGRRLRRCVYPGKPM